MDRFDVAREDLDFERLAGYLKALAHPARLEILWRLRIPAKSADVVVRPRRRDAGLAEERPMSRQSVEGHMTTLEEVGVINRVPEAEGGAGEWVTSHQRVFALVEDMRRLSAIRPASRVDVDATMEEAAPATVSWPKGPKLVLVSGPWEGRVFDLAGDGPWTVGRSRESDVALTYDPFVSAEHARVSRDGETFALDGAAGARNAARVNFAPIREGAPRRIAPGDIVGVGRSLLVFQTA